MELKEAKQKLFDNAYMGLKEQKTWSWSDGKCKYRSTDNLKCAIGFSIPDHLYDERYEDTPPEEYNLIGDFLINHFGISGDFYKHNFIHFARDLQLEAHDLFANRGAKFTMDGLILFAEENNLTIPE